MISPETTRTAAAKVCLIGDEQVGKTSLVRRFVAGTYSDDYLRTLGAVVSKRVVSVSAEGGVPTAMTLIIYDIMGRKDAEALADAYFANAQGVFAVMDVTRPDTLQALDRWMKRVRSVVDRVPIVVLANKVDLVDQRAVDAATIASYARWLGAELYETSAKNGHNVDAAFRSLAQEVRLRQLAQQEEVAEAEQHAPQSEVRRGPARNQ